MSGNCDVGRCKKPSELKYSAFEVKNPKTVGVCWKHWEKHCDEEDKFDLRKYFSTKRRIQALEATHSQK